MMMVAVMVTSFTSSVQFCWMCLCVCVFFSHSFWMRWFFSPCVCFMSYAQHGRTTYIRQLCYRHLRTQALEYGQSRQQIGLTHKYATVLSTVREPSTKCVTYLRRRMIFLRPQLSTIIQIRVLGLHTVICKLNCWKHSDKAAFFRQKGNYFE